MRPSTPAAVEREMLESQGVLLEPESVVEGKEELRGTGVGARKEAYPAGEVVEGTDTGTSPPRFRRATAHLSPSQLPRSSTSPELSLPSRSVKPRSVNASTRATARRRRSTRPTLPSTSLSSSRCASSCPCLPSLEPTLLVWDSPTTTSELLTMSVCAEQLLIIAYAQGDRGIRARSCLEAIHLCRRLHRYRWRTHLVGLGRSWSVRQAVSSFRLPKLTRRVLQHCHQTHHAPSTRLYPPRSFPSRRSRHHSFAHHQAARPLPSDSQPRLDPPSWTHLRQASILPPYRLQGARTSSSL